MKRKWHYLENQFVASTKYSFKKAFKLSRYHDNRLKKYMDENPGDAEYEKAYNRYHLLHLALVVAYDLWKSRGGLQVGETLTLIQLLKLLPAKINKIDVKIQAFHDKGSARWVQLFPNSHIPFYTGSQDTKISAVNTLSLTIGSEAPMAAIKTEVDGIYTELTTAKAVQDGAKGMTDDASVVLEAARIKAMNMQYQNLGLFIDKFPVEPDKIEQLFDVETLTDPAQTIWKGHLEPLENHPTLVHTFEAGDMMRLKSTGNAGIKAYLASTPGGTDSVAVSVEAHQEKIFDVAVFGVEDYSKNRYLTIVNISDGVETRFLLELY